MEELNKLPAYIYIDGEQNRAYLIISRDIQGNWTAAYWAQDGEIGRFYHPVSEETLRQTAQSLKKELSK